MSMERTLDQALTERDDSNPLTLTDGVVTALNADGTVRLKVDGAEGLDATYLASYTARAIGDVVAVLRQDRRMLVIGKITKAMTE